MSQQDPAEAVDEIIADVLRTEPDAFDNDAVFGTDLQAESLDYVEIAETIEFELGVGVPDEKLEEIETVDHLKSYVTTEL
jgi:acyl carrier protein